MTQEYYDQFYDPYREYDAPIFAVPGNHDGVMFPGEPIKHSLEPFVNNFCTKTPGHHPAAQGCARTTMIQPGVHFTLGAPFLKIIGLWTGAARVPPIAAADRGPAGAERPARARHRRPPAAVHRQRQPHA